VEVGMTMDLPWSVVKWYLRAAPANKDGGWQPHAVRIESR
jgi:hypothetical protein